MIVFDEEMYLDSDFTDIHLQFILDMYGPDVKDKLLLPGAVVINVHPADES